MNLNKYFITEVSIKKKRHHYYAFQTEHDIEILH